MALTVIPLSGLASDVVDSISAGAGGGGPRIANVQIANSSWGLLDDTAVGTDGGYVLINGSGFVSGCSVLVANSQATPVTFANSSLLRVEVPAKAASTYAVYVLNPDGGTAIGINALTYSAFPAWATGSTLTAGAADAAISVQLSASDATTYTLQAGSSLPANTTLASNGLFSGTITGINEETTYTFTVEATDAENQNTPRTFSITITTGDSNFKNTVLLLNADANTFVRDASNNNFAITVNGDTRPSAFSPYNTNWSIYIDGTDDLNAASNAAFTYGTADFTIEGWFYVTGRSGGNDYEYFFAQGATTGASSLGLYRQGNVLKVWQGASVLTGTTAFSTLYNTWVHIALTRSGTTMRLFLNGALEGSATNSGNITTGTTTGISIGRWTEIGDGNYIVGYVSNFRVVKGTAVYTSAFTPSTTPLTAITNTSLLACQDNRFIDKSTNNFTLTKNGDTAIKAFGPFTETDVTTGSGYFDGTGDYLTVPYNSAWDFLTGNFTIESWLYPTTSGTVRVIAASFTSSGNDGWSLELTTGDAVTFYAESAYRITSSLTVPSNKWTHVAVSRSGTSLRIFIDGVLNGTVTDAVSIAGFSGLLAISATQSGTALYVGYQSNFRVVKGTAVYTSTFTPPTEPLTAVANTQLLTLQNRIGYNNHQFVDESGFSHLITRNGNASQGSFSPYSPAGWSGYFDGSSNGFLSTPPTTDLDLSGDFTLQAWIYPTADSQSQGSEILSRGAPSTLNGWHWYYYNNKLNFGFNYSGFLGANITTLTKNSWTHVALTRSGNTFTYYVNGIADGTFTSSATPLTNVSDVVYVGRGSYDSTNRQFPGYMSNVSVIKGTALTTFNLTTPLLTSTSGQSLLTCTSNRFIDTNTATSGKTLTVGSGASVQAFSPFAPTTAYSASTVGGSGYFDGTGDYLSVASNAALGVGSGDFTLECWVYLTANFDATGQGIITAAYDTNFALIGVNTGAGNKIDFYVVNTVLSTGTNYISLNTWTHIAAVRSSGTTKIYFDGVEKASSGSLTGTGAAATLYIGTLSHTLTQEMTGYISSARLVKGSAVYTSAFTPPTAPVTAIANTSFLLNYTNGGIIDATAKNVLETVGGAAISTAQSKFGGSSMAFDGTTDYVVQPSSLNYGYGTGDFTIEFWLYLNSTGLQTIFSNLSAATGGVQPHIYINTTIRYYTNSADRITGAALSAGQWYHIAVSRGSGSTRLFVNGTQSGSTYADTNNYTTGPLGVGTYWEAGVPITTSTLNGYIDDLRITKGYARYTANFTAPTQAFPTQ